MLGKKKIEAKLTQKMQEAFSSTKDRKKAIHLTAAAGAAIVATLPIGVDAWALRIAEVIMIICIAGSYGEKLSKSAAKGLMLSSFAQLAGETAAIVALEAAEASKVATAGTGIGPAVAYSIKSGIAVGLIEAIGHLVLASYENPKGIGAKACKATELIGMTADVSRATSAISQRIKAVSTTRSNQLSSAGASLGGESSVSFCGSSYTQKDLADAGKTVNAAERKVSQCTTYVENDIKNRRDTTLNLNKVKYAERNYKDAVRKYEYIEKQLKAQQASSTTFPKNKQCHS